MSRQADCFMAAYLASEVAIKLMRPGNKNAQVTRAIAKVAEAFGCAPISGVLSHQMKRCAAGMFGVGSCRARIASRPQPALPSVS
jgi:methionine aminopeptidase